MVVSVTKRGSRKMPNDYPGNAYERIVDDIESRIMSGEFQDGSRMPSGQRLAWEFGVAISTYQRAASLLKKRGLITVAPGWGTFVVSPGQAERSG